MAASSIIGHGAQLSEPGFMGLLGFGVEMVLITIKILYDRGGRSVPVISAEGTRLFLSRVSGGSPRRIAGHVIPVHPHPN